MCPFAGDHLLRVGRERMGKKAPRPRFHTGGLGLETDVHHAPPVTWSDARHHGARPRSLGLLGGWREQLLGGRATQRDFLPSYREQLSIVAVAPSASALRPRAREKALFSVLLPCGASLSSLGAFWVLV